MRIAAAVRRWHPGEPAAAPGRRSGGAVPPSRGDGRVLLAAAIALVALSTSGSCHLVCDLPGPLVEDVGDEATADEGGAEGTECSTGEECNDEDACTTDTCVSGFCGSVPRVPPPPAPAGPMHGATTGSSWAPPGFGTRRPVFRWTWSDDGCGEPTFAVEVDDACGTPGFASCAFPNPEAATAAVSGSSWRPDEDLPVVVAGARAVGQRYYWRVRACRGPSCSAWSPVRCVDVGRVRNDFNGDGWSDIIVGAPRNDTGGVDAGRAYVFFGGDRPDDDPDLFLTGERPGDRFGARVAGAGDVNADGFADMAVSAPGSDIGGAESGIVYLYLGGSAPRSEAYLALTVEEPWASLGESLAGAGDVNGDGFADIAVGAPGRDATGLANSGEAYVHFGGAPPDGTADVVLAGEAEGDECGGAVAGAGDVDGDGLADLIVGAPRHDAGEILDAGRAYVHFGGTRFGEAVGFPLTGVALSGGFARSVAMGGDVNADGFDDVVVGAPNDDTLAEGAGRVYVYSGGRPMDAVVDLTAEGALEYSYLGSAVAGAGDLTGDGIADFAAGGHGAGDSGWQGRAYVYYGGPGLDGVDDRDFTGEASGDGFGRSVAGAGDVNGDGFADVVVGAPENDIGGDQAGRAYVFFGGPEPDDMPDLVLTGFVAGDEFGAAVD